MKYYARKYFFIFDDLKLIFLGFAWVSQKRVFYAAQAERKRLIDNSYGISCFISSVLTKTTLTMCHR